MNNFEFSCMKREIIMAPLRDWGDIPPIHVAIVSNITEQDLGISLYTIHGTTTLLDLWLGD